jgi:hypothetical protein
MPREDFNLPHRLFPLNQPPFEPYPLRYDHISTLTLPQKFEAQRLLFESSFYRSSQFR